MLVERHGRNHFGSHPPAVANPAQRANDRRPIGVAGKQFDETVNGADAAAEILEMHPTNARTENGNPMLGITRRENIADIEIAADPFAAERIDKGPHFQRTEEEFVPDIFDRQMNVMPGGERHCTPNKFAGALVGEIVRDLLGAGNEINPDRAGHHQDGVNAEGGGALDLPLENVRGAFAHRGVVAGGVGAPIKSRGETAEREILLFGQCADGGQLGARALQMNWTIFRKIRLEAGEARIRGHLHFAGQIPIGRERPDVDSFFHGSVYKQRAERDCEPSGQLAILQRKVKTPDSKTTQNLRRLVREISLPPSLFSGLTIQQSFAPDNIIFFQRTDTAALKPEGVSNNFHHRFELTTVLEKAGPVRIDRTTYLLQPGECALIFPNQFHHYMDVEPGRLEWLFITFELRSAEPIRGLQNSPRVLDQKAAAYLLELVTEFRQPRTGAPDSLEISFTLSRLLLHLLTCPTLPKDRFDIHSSDDVRDVILESINRYVRANLSRAVTIADIAGELGYSVSHLRAVFRDRLGVSLGRYMRESRLSEAAQLLQSSDLNVSDIGERCGFESLYAFSRAFRKAYGIPPRSYRQLVQEGGALPMSGK